MGEFIPAAGRPPAWTNLPDGAAWLQRIIAGANYRLDRTVNLKLLGAIATEANTIWKNVTDAVNIYTVVSVNTFYSGTVDSPLATHAYDAGDQLGTSGTGRCYVVGIVGSFTPDVEVVPFGGYTSDAIANPLLFLSGKKILGLQMLVHLGTGTTTIIERVSDGHVFFSDTLMYSYFGFTAAGPNAWLDIPATTNLRVRVSPTATWCIVAGIAICKV